MSGVSESPSVPPNDPEDSGGISPLDLDSLPDAPRKIMRLILRKPDISEADLRAAIDALPGVDKPDPAELDNILVDMLDRRWLLKSDDGRPSSYRINLRRKAVRTLTKDLWDALDSGATPGRLPKRQSGGPSER